MTFENIDFRCIKGIPIDSVETRMLGEMGFPVDVPPQPDMTLNAAFSNYVSKVFDTPFGMPFSIEKIYINSLLKTRSKEEALRLTLHKIASTNINCNELAAGLYSNCILNLEASEVETLIEEFVFIIKELIPRQLSDIFYSFDIEPNPAYGIFFTLAVEKLGLISCADKDSYWYRQFIEHTRNGIKKRFAAGETLLSIYQKTCASKEIIKDTISSIPHNTYDSIELMLFSLSKKYSYTRTEDTKEYAADFVVYKEGEEVLNIIFLSEEELAHIDDYEQYLSELKVDDYPLLVLDHYELYTEYLSTPIRKALKDPEYIKEHLAKRVRCFRYEKAIGCSDYNYEFAETAKLCGCYSCGQIFPPEEIRDWHVYSEEENDGYAYCPCCDEASVIMDSQGIEITEAFMYELVDYNEMRDDFYD